MGYWKQMYGPRSNEFIAGAEAAIDTYAVWNNGKRWIGSPEKEAKKVIEEMKRDLGYYGEEE